MIFFFFIIFIIGRSLSGLLSVFTFSISKMSILIDVNNRCGYLGVVVAVRHSWWPWTTKYLLDWLHTLQPRNKNPSVKMTSLVIINLIQWTHTGSVCMTYCETTLTISKGGLTYIFLPSILVPFLSLHLINYSPSLLSPTYTEALTSQKWTLLAKDICPDYEKVSNPQCYISFNTEGKRSKFQFLIALLWKHDTTHFLPIICQWQYPQFSIVGKLQKRVNFYSSF